MNALVTMGGNPGSGWLLGAACWLVLRLIARLDVMEETQAATRAKVDEIHKKVVGGPSETGHGTDET